MSLHAITALVVVGFAVSAGALAISTYTSARDRSQTLDTVAVEASSLKLYEDVRSAGFAESAAAASYFGIPRQEFFDRFLDARVEAESSIAELKELIQERNPAELRTVEELERGHAELANTYDAFLSALESGDDSDAFLAVENRNLVQQAGDFWEGLETAIVAARERSVAAQAESDAAARSLDRLALGIAAAWTVVLAAAGVAVFHWVVRPLSRVAAAARRIAEGDMEARSPVTGPIEVAGLAVDVNSMADSLIERSDQLNAYLAKNLESRTVELERVNVALGDSEKRFRSLVQNAPDMFTVVDIDTRVLYQSPSVKQVLGYESHELKDKQLSSFVHEEDTAALLALLREQQNKPDGVVRIEARFRHEDGSWRHLELAISGGDYQDNPVGGIVLNCRDITEHKRLEEELRYQAFHDSLTGLANRARFTDRLEHALTRSRRTLKLAAVLFVDLDNFKAVNDSLGHASGDILLKGVAERIQGCLRAGDTAARFGGDEFAILIEDADEPADATAAADRVLDVLRFPFSCGGKDVFIRASIGIATALPADGNTVTVQTILRDADVAMYAAKRRGKSQYEVYDATMHLSLLRRFKLLNDLHAAVEREEFFVAYQPTVHLRTGAIYGLEALARWRHPSYGIIMPDEFIPLAEDAGVIRPLGKWVLAEACRQLSIWQRQFPGHKRLSLAVNVSVRQLNPSFAQEVQKILDESRLDPSLLTLEVTESITLEPVDATMQVLNELKAIGVRLAIDDFGMGSSSFNYLQTFPFDIVKIDKAFVQHGPHERSSRELTRKVIELGKVLNLQVIAEGIEEDAQLEELRGMDCEIGQGYLFAKPLDADDVADHLRRNAPAQAA